MFRLDMFFRTFTAFGLFRETRFMAKLHRIPSKLNLKALLAMMFAFACRDIPPDHSISATSKESSAARFADAGLRHVNLAIEQCGDEIPPLCVLQALILATHWLILKGVRGKAWRSVGVCIRLVFELGLHTTDSDNKPDQYLKDAEKWCEDEERRRAYWAVWEMDQFSSHMKHIPITIDWAQQDVYLPAEDERWFAGLPQLSCTMASDMIDRSKNLHVVDNASERAWYIVVAALGAEAYEIGYPKEKVNRRSRERILETQDQWPAISNAIRLCMLLIPDKLKFTGQYLDFGTQSMGYQSTRSTPHNHSAIYLITMLSQGPNMIALRAYVFEAYMRKLIRLAEGGTEETNASIPEEMMSKIGQCFKAADAVLNVHANCHDSYYKYITPYVAAVTWGAATVQLLRHELEEDESQKMVIRSKFEVLRATHNQFIQYWGMSQVPRQSLDTLEQRLAQFAVASRDLVVNRGAKTNGSLPGNVQGNKKSNSERQEVHRYNHADKRNGAGEQNTPSDPTRAAAGSAGAFREDYNPNPDPFNPQELGIGVWDAADANLPEVSFPDMDANLNPIDWASFFTNVDAAEYITDCVDIFSGPGMG